MNRLKPANGIRFLLNLNKTRCSFTTNANLSSASAKNDSPETKNTHFGFETVPETEKTEKVYKVFETVADKYGLMNDAMSLGIHRLWKDIFIHRLAATKDTKLLDVAGGTGDIAFRFVNYVNDFDWKKSCSVTVCDINKSMLEVGKKRAVDDKLDESMLKWVEGNAESLPFEDNSFNAYTIAFGIRNVTHIDKVLNEAYRVLKPGGRFMCLEFSQLPFAPAQWAYDQYSFQVIPVMGQILAGQWQPYKYLVESIRKFPNQETFKAIIEEAGFREVSYENLTLGIVAIHSGFKL